MKSTNQLALELLRRLDGGANVVISPYSIQAALAMVDQGAAGATAQQIDRVLDTPDAAGLAAANGTLRSRLVAAASRGGPRLRIANGLWLQSGLSLEPGFSGSLRANFGFGAAPAAVDFEHQPSAAAQTINRGVSSRTAGVIRDLMPPGAITRSTSLVLANAIYLKARWQSPFDRSMTRPLPFIVPSGHNIQAQFMTETPIALRYGSGSGYRAVELPYRASTLSMLVVIPDAGTLEQFERELTPARLSLIAKTLKPQLLALAMPRFHLSAHTELNGVLSALGMPIAFTPQADFSGITGSSGPGLEIQAVEHGADLNVDEAGTVAAAATGISVVPTLAPAGHVTRLVLDHPFLALVRDDQTGAILFAARVMNPTRS